MNTLKNEIEIVKKQIRDTRRQFLVLVKDVMRMIRTEEGLEHRLFTLEENHATMNKRLTSLEEYVYNMSKHLNGAIERINALHMYLKEKEEEEEEEFDLNAYLKCAIERINCVKCSEVVVSSDEEFDLDNMDPVFEKRANLKNNEQF